MTDNPTLSEMQAAIDALVPLMIEKGCVRPEVGCNIRGNEGLRIILRASPNGTSIGSYDMEIFSNADFPGLLKKASDHIAALPDPDEANQRRYMDKVAETIDLGAELGIDDEYVEPLRMTRKAMAENLLTSEAS